MFGSEFRLAFPWKRRSHRRVTDLLVQCLNARAYDTVAALLTDDFAYYDTMSEKIVGPRKFVDAMRLFHQRVPDLRIEVVGYSTVAGSLLITGRIDSADPDFSSDSLWRAEFRGSQVCELQAFRENNIASLAALYKRSRNKSEAAA